MYNILYFICLDFFPLNNFGILLCQNMKALDFLLRHIIELSLIIIVIQLILSEAPVKSPKVLNRLPY